MVRLPSVLWRDPEHRTIVRPDPTLVSDLNLDRVFAEIAVPGSGESVDRLLREPLLDSADVEFRQEVFADLSAPALRAQLEAFARSIAQIRQHLSELPMVHHSILRCRRRLDILNTYCQAVMALHQGLDRVVAESRGLKSWREYCCGTNRFPRRASGRPPRYSRRSPRHCSTWA